MNNETLFWSYSSNNYICIFFKRNEKAHYASISNRGVFYIYCCSISFIYLDNAKDGWD